MVYPVLYLSIYLNVFYKINALYMYYVILNIPELIKVCLLVCKDESFGYSTCLL